MFIVKILVWTGLFSLILLSGFFQKILVGMGNAITSINGDFWAYLPTEIRVFFSLIVLGMLFGLIYAFKK